MVADVAGRVTAPARRPAASAGIPILAAKITVPGVPDWAVPRPRITKLIAEGTRRCPLTIVTGPPGAGKTMALALWAAAEAGTVAWISLDDFDNQPGAFWSYVVAALGRSGVAIPKGLSAASRRRLADHTFLVRLTSVLAAQNPPVTLVVDDLHVLTKPTVLTELDFVLRNAYSGLRLVVSSRVDPPLSLHRYRLAGELTEIRASDLAFNADEARLLLAQHGSTLSADSLKCLTRRTEGWAAGLRLAAISMDGHPDPDQFVKELITEDSALTGYLVEEVLNAAPPEVREVLLSTSILEHVNAEVASELTGNGPGRADPAGGGACQRVRPADRRRVVSLPHVVRGGAAAEAEARVPGPDRLLCTGRAARWYERNGHADRCGAARRAGRRLASLPPAWSSTRWRSVRSSSRGAARPWLMSSGTCRTAKPGRSRSRTSSPPRSRCPLAGTESAAAALDAAERMLRPLPADEQAARPAGRRDDPPRRFPPHRGSHSGGGGRLGCRGAGQQDASGQARPVPGSRARVLFDRGAVELWPGRLDEAARFLDAGVAAATGPGGEHELVDCLGYLALVEALRGQLRHAAQLAGQAVALAADEQRPPSASGPCGARRARLGAPGTG